MLRIEIMGTCPNKIINKAKKLLDLPDMSSVSYKKLSGIKKAYSIRVNQNYRVLIANGTNAYIGSHNHYDKKIKNLKKGKH